jgi:hypothetical protein
VILDWVYKKRIPLTQVYQVGSDLVLELAAVIPNEAEVSEVEDFTEAAPAASTG